MKEICCVLIDAPQLVWVYSVCASWDYDGVADTCEMEVTPASETLQEHLLLQWTFNSPGREMCKYIYVVVWVPGSGTKWGSFKFPESQWIESVNAFSHHIRWLNTAYSHIQAKGKIGAIHVDLFLKIQAILCKFTLPSPSPWVCISAKGAFHRKPTSFSLFTVMYLHFLLWFHCAALLFK